MELDSQTTQYVPIENQAIGFVLCADCGIAIEPNTAGLCVNCLRNTIDITEDIPKQAALSFCRNCSRYLSPPQTWLLAELESKELLAICLRKLKSLTKVRLIDAGFIWTEPHSKRLRVKLTIQKEVLASTILQQIFEVEYVIQHTQCPACCRLAAKNMWRALVQVRQKVDHKRTFLYLEQLILKHNADKDTVGIKESKDGLDFFYATRQHAIKMVEFLSAISPVRSKASEQLISADDKNSTANFKFTYSVELVPICKDDIVCLPQKLARSQSNILQLLVCTRVGTSIHLVDPLSLRSIDLQGPVYWRNPFPSLASISSCIEFVVLDIEPTNHPPVQFGHFVLADAQISPVSSSMSDESIFHTRTHLGGILRPGDTVLGYHLTNSNFNDDNFSSLNSDRIPEVVLVRKTYPDRRKKNKKRKWRLRSIAKEAEDGANEHTGLGRVKFETKKSNQRADQAKIEAEYEMFLRDLEEDPELRQNVQMFKADSKSQQQDSDTMDVEDGQETDTEIDEDDGFPVIQLDELLDEMDALKIEEQEDEGSSS
ncbi:NMD3 family-domain-containing protein [Phakopsora pachyrhizi]|uniref:60S ribosomal export protein NMD3 n=1 Tax=Phakopsora pachyrhizi TaxID=170000 RepID=A0AAV0BFR8_PHAPC|nr:NMD3 family-domain-containing protein [Phakopsora pachyrhizi]CAH7686133.1 NMD3 family-domain-containing protein [Phakopsora pachyrhizi]